VSTIMESDASTTAVDTIAYADLPGTPRIDGEILDLALVDIDPDPQQARDEGADEDLAPSIAANGVLEPIRVYAHPDPAAGKPWRLENGERRYRGALKAGLATIPGRVVPAPAHDGEKLLRQNLANDGKRLRPMEEARSWKRIMDAYGWSIQQLADGLGKAKSTVSDRLAMLNAPAPFQPLFASGALSPAAAPIVRRYANLPERVVKAFANVLAKDLEDFVKTGTPAPLSAVENVFRHSNYAVGLRNIDHSDAAKTYQGETTTIDGKRYAIDGDAWDKHQTAHWDRRNAPATEREASAAEKREQARQAAERKRQREKQALRRAHFAAISAKLPTMVGPGVAGADWTPLLLELIMREVHQDTLRVLAAQLGLTAEKSRRGGMDRYGEAIKKHAAGVGAGGRVQLALQLLLAPDLNIPPYIARGTERFAAAAKLLKLDLKKIKPVAEKATGTPKPAAKKRR